MENKSQFQIYVTFEAGGADYALPIENVRGIISTGQFPTSPPSPNEDPCIDHIIETEGTFVPILNIAKTNNALIEKPPVCPIILLESNDNFFGILADVVRGLTNYSDEDLKIRLKVNDWLDAISFERKTVFLPNLNIFV